MPSVPQSLLWISLVVLWLFVLVPMLVNKRDAVRRTSDVALATRVLNGGAGARLLKRGRPAAGHRSDPDWQRDEDEGVDSDDHLDQELGQEEKADDMSEPGSVVVKAAAVDAVEPDYLDVEVVSENSGALPAGASLADVAPAVVDDESVDTDANGDGAAQPSADGADADLDEIGQDDTERFDSYELVEDTAGLEPGADQPPTTRPTTSRRRRYDSLTADAVSARKYKFRKRALITMALVLVGSATAAFAGQSFPWWICGTATGVTVLYLAYLRRQTRIEEQVRRRRMQRLARSQFGAEHGYEREFGSMPPRRRHPDAAVLEIDDEDPMFEHLDGAMYSRGFGWPRDLPRAAGQ